MSHLSESQIMSRLGPPYILPVKRTDGSAPPDSVPKYTVMPSPFTDMEGDIKIVVIGQGEYTSLSFSRRLNHIRYAIPLLINYKLFILIGGQSVSLLHTASKHLNCYFLLIL